MTVLANVSACDTCGVIWYLHNPVVRVWCDCPQPHGLLWEERDVPRFRLVAVPWKQE